MIPGCFAGLANAAWSDLIEELDLWAEAGQVAALWWRDDDAVEQTAQLDRLLGLAEAVPLALAVIPATVQPSLASALAGAPDVVVLQHGWAHANHAGTGKKSEFPSSRPARAVFDELITGRKRLAELFGPRFMPVLVPPWNRFADDFLPLLAEAGLYAISRIPRPTPASPIPEIDVHVDLVDWHAERGFIGEASALAGLLAQLRRRRLGEHDRITGILTHHLVMDAAAAGFLARLVALVREHPAAAWVIPAACRPDRDRTGAPA